MINRITFAQTNTQKLLKTRVVKRRPLRPQFVVAGFFLALTRPRVNRPFLASFLADNTYIVRGSLPCRVKQYTRGFWCYDMI